MSLKIIKYCFFYKQVNNIKYIFNKMSYMLLNIIIYQQVVSPYKIEFNFIK